MHQNKISIIINKPIEEVFAFTTNPQNTHLWYSSIKEEISSEYPPKINTEYKNRGGGKSEWSCYKVSEFKNNEKFALVDSEGNYNVKYTYKKLNDNQTKMEYFEWVEKGELESPFTEKELAKLKVAIGDKK